MCDRLDGAKYHKARGAGPSVLRRLRDDSLPPSSSNLGCTGWPVPQCALYIRWRVCKSGRHMTATLSSLSLTTPSCRCTGSVGESRCEVTSTLACCLLVCVRLSVYVCADVFVCCWCLCVRVCVCVLAVCVCICLHGRACPPVPPSLTAIVGGVPTSATLDSQASSISCRLWREAR